MRHTQTIRWLRGLLTIGSLVWYAGIAGAGTVSEIAAVPYLTEKGREEYAKFLAAGPARAFAVAENGAWGFSEKRDTRSRAVAIALYRCNKAAHDICRVYAVNEDVVYSRYAAFEERSRTLLGQLTTETFRFAEYGSEDRDYRSSPVDGLLREPYHEDTPTELKGVVTIKTVALVKLLTTPTPPILIDALEGDGHKTIPGALWIRGAGIYGRNGTDNGEIQDRLGLPTSIVFFCLDSHCRLSYNAVWRARELGYTNLYWYRGGVEAWGAALLDSLDAVQYGQVW